MTAFDPRTNTHSSAAAITRDNIHRLSDSALTTLYREASKNSETPTGDVSRRRMEERVLRFVLRSKKGKQSLERRRREDRERKRKAKEEGR